MDPTDLTLEVLRSIRDEVRGLGVRQDTTNQRLDEVVQHQIRQGTDLAEMRGDIGQMRGDIGQMRGEIGELRALQRETIAAVEHVARAVHENGERIDNILIGPVGETLRDHERRLQRLETPSRAS